MYAFMKQEGCNSNITDAIFREIDSNKAIPVLSSIHTISLTMYEHYIYTHAPSELPTQVSGRVNEWQLALKRPCYARGLDILTAIYVTLCSVALRRDGSAA
jgi:hypothetical protein